MLWKEGRVFKQRHQWKIKYRSSSFRCSCIVTHGNVNMNPYIYHNILQYTYHVVNANQGGTFCLPTRPHAVIKKELSSLLTEYLNALCFKYDIMRSLTILSRSVENDCRVQLNSWLFSIQWMRYKKRCQRIETMQHSLVMRLPITTLTVQKLVFLQPKSPFGNHSPSCSTRKSLVGSVSNLLRHSPCQSDGEMLYFSDSLKIRYLY